MRFWDGGWHMGGLGMIFLWVAVIGVVVLAVWLLASRGRGAVPGSEESPETILKRRYARGEIDRDEYMRRLDDLRK